MCIIAIKRPGQEALPLDTIKLCWHSNPDGAGFVIHRPGGGEKLLIQKGFMTLAAFRTALDAAAIQSTDTVIYHFRIATSGGISPANCHPFPISAEPKDVKALEITCDRAFVHNGIIGKGTRRFSDTQLYVLNILSGITDIKGNLEKIGQDTIGSRTVTLEANGDMHLTGAWITDPASDYLFSNNSFQPASYFGFGDSFFMEEPESCGVCGSALISLDRAFICGECQTAYVLCDNCGAWEHEGDLTEYQDEDGVSWALCWECRGADDDDSAEAVGDYFDTDLQSHWVGER